jgi:hypothetical protein
VAQLIHGSLGGNFTIASHPTIRRLVVALDGLEKQGKTHFALTAPGPIAIQNLDIGLEGVIEKFQTDKLIHRADYSFLAEKGDTQDQMIAKATPVFMQFLHDYKDIVIPRMKTGEVRSGVIDTGGELWELQRLARLGKLTQVMPHHYTALNMEYQNLIREVYSTPGNLIILHKLKAEWKDNPTTGKGNKTGQYERAGFSGTGFLVQVNATAYRDSAGVFHILVRDCRQNPEVAGLDLEGDMATFPNLGMMVYPDSALEDWQ